MSLRSDAGPLPFRQKDAKGPALPTVAKYKRYNWGEDASPATKDGSMPHMNTLIAFSLLGEKEQEAFILQKKASTGGGQNRFVKIVKILHWDTQDIDQLVDNYRVFVTEELAGAKPREQCLDLIERYIESWNRLGCVYTPPPQARHIAIQGLSILVKPEVGARPHETQLRPRLIKLWLRPEPVSDTVCSMAAYLMDRLGQQYGWGGLWKPEVWDVRRRGVVSRLWDSQTEARVQLAARRYAELWASL